ncbi:hypothetical protein E6R60_05905 [Streptomyces sp. A0642]|uniref:phage tail assembly protein T n=1 Tax=Streptomyces sp. A0642 TaxID=2563100 RepID=UPI0010A27CDB|nr:hypothetical protein [Streptomyces sp. A0642]THA78416.1 hypothetical protein E6R60_05905 [Streptomyces sp. A0642]
MTPAEVLDRFAEEEMIRLLAYQNLYGPAGPQRFDALFARLGMDVAAPHMKKGKRPKFKDHLIQWSRNARPRKSGRELLAAVKGIQAAYDQQDQKDRKGRGR